MSWSVLSTWKMSLEGCRIAAQQLAKGATAADALVAGIENVEDNPKFCSVGFGGLPARDGHVYLDGGFMDGDTLRFGAVGSIEGFRSPIRIAWLDRAQKRTPKRMGLKRGITALQRARLAGKRKKTIHRIWYPTMVMIRCVF